MLGSPSQGSSLSEKQLELVNSDPAQDSQSILQHGPIQNYGVASWVPNRKQIVFEGKEKNQDFKVYVQEISGSEPRAITPEGFGIEKHSVSPDGKFVVTLQSTG